MDVIRGGDRSKGKRVRRDAEVWYENGMYYARSVDYEFLDAVSGETELEALQNLTKEANTVAEGIPTPEEFIEGLKNLPHDAGGEIWDVLLQLRVGKIDENTMLKSFREILSRYRLDTPTEWRKFLDREDWENESSND